MRLALKRVQGTGRDVMFSNYSKLKDYNVNRNQLWNSILQQAISGKLVPQLDSEPEVEQVGPAPAQDEVPFELPAKWKWVQAGYLGDWKSGQTPSRTNQLFWSQGTIPWLKSGEITDGLISNIEEKVTELAVQDLNLRVNPPEAVVIALYGATAGKVGILLDSCVTNQACCVCIVNNEITVNWYLFYTLLAIREKLLYKRSGSAQPNLSKVKVVTTWIPIPPLEEQRRIVARLAEVLLLVERFGEAQEQLVKLEAEFPSKLKASVLQQAIRGELVPQLDCEPEVEQVGPAPKPDEVPFELPPKWKWARFSHLINCLDSMRIPVKKADRDKQQKVYDYYGATGVIDQVEDYIFDKRLLLIGEDGANLLSRSKDNAFFAEGKYWVNNHAHVFDENGLASLDYLAIYINAISLAPYVTGSAQPKLTLTRLKSIWTPLPPLEEQRRIVAKVEELFAGVKQLSSLMEYA